MFTGIIHFLGHLVTFDLKSDQASIWVQLPQAMLDMRPVKIGDSIAINGICLTLVELEADAKARFDLSHETLERTAAKNWTIGQVLNLERALCLSEGVDGHLISGHVDGLGIIKRLEAQAEGFLCVTIAYPSELAHLMAYKGSVTVNGISLTLNALDDQAYTFELTLIPHTVDHTDIKYWQLGQAVNLEIDLLARYCERILSFKTFQQDA